MKLLRNPSWWRALRRLAAGRGRRAPQAYSVTVPAPLPASNVVELRRPVVQAPTAPSLPRAANA
ncbi:MAG TPA: hypothetical protein VGU65_09805 [Frateuria sp.]|uniref:hypothetical protein n=1 Tax=Frateuria sp. TaxID=2211372 RepID=UPI002DE559D6|nr:hypothetical protein [Frateuria sp.]